MTIADDKTMQEQNSQKKASINMNKTIPTPPAKGKKNNGKPNTNSSVKPITSQIELKVQTGYDNFNRGFIETKAERVRLQTQLLICGSAKDNKAFADIGDHLASISTEFSKCLEFQAGHDGAQCLEAHHVLALGIHRPNIKARGLLVVRFKGETNAVCSFFSADQLFGADEFAFVFAGF